MTKKELLKWVQHQDGTLRAMKRKRGNAYLFRYYWQGKQRSENFRYGTDPLLIKVRIQEINSKVDQYKLGIGNGVEPRSSLRNGISLEEMTVWFLKAKRDEGRSIYTSKNYEHAMKKLIAFVGQGNMLAEHVERNTLDAFKRHLLTSGLNDFGAKSVLVHVTGVFRKAHYEGLLSHYKFMGFKYPENPTTREYPVLTIDEMKKLAFEFKDEKLRLLWNWQRLTGMRGSDSMHVEGKNIDYENRILKFTSRKLKRQETIPLHPILIGYLEPVRQVKGKLFDLNIKNDSVSHVYGKTIRALKGDNFKPSGTHTPRHSLGSYLENEADWRQEDISLFLCHRRNSITFRYTHSKVSKLQKLVDKLSFS